ncbi:uncharacterized protein E0L32_001201 [Thyridium curvatum]|uniref:Copper acquisition factor BIM1-like domain-containing protein n=1 Tax=Thyridium curvatum TaxID=1093900 RepID=A0A507AUG7_9PEZI|nr:uncharacterized protein E0L32_001201 [Thyridium curvatum]TPX11383.1 hypothetical protein E0L32_001201 [Thyridium curvatum]
MLSSQLIALALAAVTSAHTVISYPGWRGDNLVTNASFPYGMQWMYPCGGIPLTHNRTYWPVTGGAIALQPGWFQGHATAQLFINLGIGDEAPDGGPLNMSLPMVPQFGILGPSKNPYPGTICLPQVPMPANLSLSVGQNVTIQVVELAVHGAALFSCVDVTLVEPNDPRLNEVNETNCFNSTDIGFSDVYTITTRASGQAQAQGNGTVTSAAVRTLSQVAGWMPVVVGGLWALL